MHMEAALLNSPETSYSPVGSSSFSGKFDMRTSSLKITNALALWHHFILALVLLWSVSYNNPFNIGGAQILFLYFLL